MTGTQHVEFHTTMETNRNSPRTATRTRKVANETPCKRPGPSDDGDDELATVKYGCDSTGPAFAVYSTRGFLHAVPSRPD